MSSFRLINFKKRALSPGLSLIYRELEEIFKTPHKKVSADYI